MKKTWYRFTSGAGGKMATECPLPGACGKYVMFCAIITLYDN